MKSFKKYLEEAGPQWQTSDVELLFRNIPHIPVIPYVQKVFKRKPITTFRVSSLNGLERLIKAQYKESEQVPSFTRLDPSHNLNFGIISANTGVITELKGTPLAMSPDDMMSIPDQKGIRWVAVESPKIIKLMKSIQTRLLQKHFKEKELHKIDPSSVEGTLKKAIMKDFYDWYKKSLASNTKEYFRELFKHINGTGNKAKNFDDWDEVLISNFEVKRAWLINDIVSAGQGTKIQEKYYKKVIIKWLPAEAVASIIAKKFQ